MCSARSCFLIVHADKWLKYFRDVGLANFWRAESWNRAKVRRYIRRDARNWRRHDLVQVIAHARGLARSGNSLRRFEAVRGHFRVLVADSGMLLDVRFEELVQPFHVRLRRF